MSYDIVLIMVPPWEPKMPPLGLAYISEYLNSKGLKPKVIDFNVNLYRNISQDKRFFWKISNINWMHPTEITLKMFDIFRNEIDVLVNQIISLNSDIVGFSVNVASSGLAGKIATLIKNKDKRKIIIFGGTGAFWDCDRRLIFPEDLWSIDAFVIGEGEIPSEMIINNYKNKNNFEGIPGIICKREDFLKPASPFNIRNVDDLPFPTFRDFKLSLYNERLIPMLTSRGCIGRCTYCIDYLMCGTYRYRSPEKILEEIKYHINVNKIGCFGFNDLICNGNLRQLEKLCDLIIQSGLKFIWGSYAIVRKDMSFELLKKMHKSGCFYLCYGLESGSTRTLKRMNKFYTREEAEKLVKMTHESGINTSINTVVGFPGETEDDFEETLSFIRNNKDYIYEVANVSSLVIMPPAKIGRNPEEYGIELPPPDKDLNFYIDENSLDIMGRTKRVRRTIFLVSMLEINNAIVNQPGLKSHSDKNNVALVFCPPARTDLPSLRLAKLCSYLVHKKTVPFIYDFNIKLFQIAQVKTKYLWEYENWYLWSLKYSLLDIFNSMEEELFRLSDELFLLETDKCCFLITPENFSFSLRIAFLLKKYNPNIYIIFSSPIFENGNIFELVPKGIVDLFIYGEEGATLLKVISDTMKDEKFVNTVVYENEAYCKQKKESCDEEHFGYADFSGFDLNAYRSARLPVSFTWK